MRRGSLRLAALFALSGVALAATAQACTSTQSSSGGAPDAATDTANDTGPAPDAASPEAAPNAPPGCVPGQPTDPAGIMNACTFSSYVLFDNCARIGYCDGGALPDRVSPPPPDGGNATDAGASE